MVGLDTETSGLNHQHDYCFGVSLACEQGGFYWDLRKQPKAIEWLDEHLDTTRTVCAHNASFDYQMLSKAGCKTSIHKWDDTCIRACLIDEHRWSFSLDDLCHEYLGQRKLDIWPELANLYGGMGTRNVQAKNLVRAPEELVRTYAIPDATLCLALWVWQQNYVDNHVHGDSLQRIFDFERGLMPRIIGMEAHGVRVDIDAAERAQQAITPIIAQKQDRLEEIVGEPVNVNSSPQVKALFDIQERDEKFWVGNTAIGRTPKGNPSLGKNELIALEDKDERAGLVLEIRSLIKTRDTFLGGHVLGSSHNNRVYPNIHQNKDETGGSGYGRLAYTTPALQQIPNRNLQVAEIVKTVFLPNEGEVWVDTDLDGFEVRCFAHLVSKFNTKIMEAYAADPSLDLHQWVADLTNLPRSPTYGMKASAKTLNLSAIFNRGNGAIAMDMGMATTRESFSIVENGKRKRITYDKPCQAAMTIINNYHAKVPGIRELSDAAKDKSKDRGFLITKAGRHLHIDKPYKASGLLIQATSADKNKENIMKIADTLEHGHLLLNTHDSYSMSIPEEHRERELKNVTEAVQNAGWRVPVILKMSGYGPNWWDAIK